VARNGARGPVAAGSRFRDRGFGDRGFRNRGFRGFNAFGFGFGFFPGFYWGWPYYPYYFDGDDCYYDADCYYGDDSQYGPPPPQYPDQNGPPQDQDLYAPPPNGSGYAPQGAPAGQPVRGSDSDDFVLIRKDGGVLFANGYIMRGGQMTYIDTNGVYRKVMLSDLDLQATRKWNDDRGTPINLPN
jgi:hypothetical protein